MKIISTNIAQPRTVVWKNKQVTTGIFKEPVNRPIYLDKADVKDDNVINRRVHGGADKACYLFSVDYYGYWKKIYADLDWQYGMFGENLTVEGLDENKIHLGDIFKIGDAVVQASQPRQPCFKLGIKFNNQGVLKEFIKHNHPGCYVRVLEPGNVKSGDDFELIEKKDKTITISDLFMLIFQKEKDINLLKKALDDENLPESVRKDLGISGE